jgi:hypothetical protein
MQKALILKNIPDKIVVFMKLGKIVMSASLNPDKGNFMRI